MVKINFEILSKKWVLKVLKRKKYKKKNGVDSVAITYGWKRRIDVNIGVSLEDLIHELVHAYLYEMCLGSINDMTTDDLEEVFAELMSKRGQELLDLAANLLGQILSVLDAKITFVQKTD